jgi:uncharacterized protein YkwD
MDYSTKEDSIEYVFEKAKHLIVPSESNNYKSKLLQSNFLLGCVVLLLVLKISTSLVSINFPQNIFFADITKITLENFVNQTRQSIGLNPLTENEKLNQAAQLKAQNMVANNYFEHTSPSGISPWYWFVQAGYKYKYAGENLAIGFFESQEVYNAWLNSPSHKANIINPNYTEIGTAIISAPAQGNSIIVVQEFGSRAVTKVATPKSTITKPVVPVITKTPPTKTQTNIVKPTDTKTNVINTTDTKTATIAPVNEKVLSETVMSIGLPRGTALNDIPSKVMNSIIYNHDIWLQNIIYSISSIVIGILLTLIFFNFHITFKKRLVLRAVLILTILTTATLINKEIIISLIPHQILI